MSWGGSRFSFSCVIASQEVQSNSLALQILALASQHHVRVVWCDDDKDALLCTEAKDAGSLVLLSRPSIGWVKKAEFGCLYTRPHEYYLNPIIGCSYRCTYCYLLARQHGRAPLRLHLETAELFDAIEEVMGRIAPEEVLFTTGELADSLAEIDLHPIACELINFFSRVPHAQLELRTKCDRVLPLLHLTHNKRTVVAFSLAPNEHILRFEPGTPSLSQRLSAAKLCQDSGYPVAIKLEPIILVDSVEQSYSEFWNEVKTCIDVRALHHLSFGCLRWSDTLGSNAIFSRSLSSRLAPVHRIEYRPGSFNNTFAHETRSRVYRALRDIITADTPVPVYLSLEEPQIITTLSEDQQ